MARLPGIRNPLSALEAMARSGGGYVRRGLEAEIPGSQALLDYIGGDISMLHRALQPLGFDEVILGKPAYSEEYGGARMAIGQAPMLPFGRFGVGQLYRGPGRPAGLGDWDPGPAGQHLRGGQMRMAPARTRGEAMKRQYMLSQLKQLTRATEEDARGLRWLPELDPKQNAFREYLMNRPYTGELERGPRYDALISRLEHIVHGPDLPERRMAGSARRALREQEDEGIRQAGSVWDEPYSDALMRSASNVGVNEIATRIERLRNLVRAKDVTPYDIDDAISGIDHALAQDITLNVAKAHGKDPEQAAHLVERAARLAAMRVFLHRRQPGQLMNREFGKFSERGMQHSTEARAHFELWDESRKKLFRQLMKQRRNLRGPGREPPGTYQGRT